MKHSGMSGSSNAGRVDGMDESESEAQVRSRSIGIRGPVANISLVVGKTSWSSDCCQVYRPCNSLHDRGGLFSQRDGGSLRVIHLWSSSTRKQATGDNNPYEVLRYQHTNSRANSDNCAGVVCDWLLQGLL